MLTSKYLSTSLPIGLLAVSASCIGSLNVVYAESNLSDTGALEDPTAQIDACMSETMAAADIPGAAHALVLPFTHKSSRIYTPAQQVPIA